MFNSMAPGETPTRLEQHYLASDARPDRQHDAKVTFTGWCRVLQVTDNKKHSR
jgi:hypothetical protein